MLKLERRGRGAFLAAMMLAIGCTGSAGKDGPPGPAGVVPVLTNDIRGTVTSEGKAPLSGVRVTATPGTAAPAITDTAGAFSFKGLDIGAYDLTFHLAGFTDQTVVAAVSLSGPTTVNVALVANLDGAVGPTVAVNDQLNVGFSTPVTVAATATGNGTLTYAWTQTGGLPVTLAGADTAALHFTTPEFLQSLGYAYPDGIADGGIAVTNARCGTRGIDHDQAAHATFQVVVTDENGVSTTSSANVFATRPTLGLRGVPLGIPVWLEGNGPLLPLDGGALQATWGWQLTAPAGSGAKLFAADGAAVPYVSGAQGQYASFIPDVTGEYTLTETVSNTGNTPCSFTVYAGTWLGMMTLTGPTDTPPVAVSTQIAALNCPQCHNNVTAPDTVTPWAKTAHATALKRKIEGSAGAAFGESCLECHTTGYDKSNTVENHGFSDVEKAANWTYPAVNQPGNWSALESIQSPNDLGDLAGIQCENCHGPQGSVSAAVHGTAATDVGARISWSEQVCASCHEEYGIHYEPSQWVQGGHADRTLALSEGNADVQASAQHCGRCHSAQGFARYAGNLVAGYSAYLTSDGKPLGASNAVATKAQLQGFGMTTATVESQTCSACHDPHDNTAGGTCPGGKLNGTDCSQLRVYDAIPSLPNGLTNISGMGAGAICITCHNSRNGEHTDFLTQAGNAATGVMAPVPNQAAPLTGFGRGPHTAAQGDFYFGFNAYFGPRLTPSPHMAVTDSCAGCHYRVTTASDVAAKETSNHSFVVDNTICASCHSANVDGVGFEAANRSQLDGLRNAFAAKLATTINAALMAPGATLWAQAYDAVNNVSSSTGTGTGTAKYNVILTAANGPITAITYTPVGTSADVYGKTAQAAVTLTLSAPIPSVTFVNADGSTNNVQTNVTAITVSLLNTSLYLAAAAPTVNPTVTPFTAPTAVQGDVQVLYKAYWNMLLLNNDNTFGVHNPSFFNNVIANTVTRLVALP